VDQVALGGKLGLQLVRSDDGVHVVNRDGQTLDPVAAEVLIGLGGEEPAWLPLVEGVRAVTDRYDDWETVQTAARAMAAIPNARRKAARTTDEPAVLIGMAAMGEVQVARNPNLTAREWDLLLENRRPETAELALRTASMLPPALHDHPDAATRMRVARNPTCPQPVLATLATDSNTGVLAAVAGNPQADQPILRQLLKDKNPTPVREAAANNRQISPKALRRCLRDKAPEVRGAAAGNPVLPSWRAAFLVPNKRSAIRRALATRPDSTSRRLAWIERCSRRDQPTWQMLIRPRIASHPNASPQLTERIDELNAYVAHGVRTPILRKVAPPSPWEAAVMFVALVGAISVVSLGARPVLLLPAVGIALLVAIHCRTVRPGMKVTKDLRTRRVPEAERLTPSTRWPRLQRGVWLVPLLAINALIQSSNSPGGGLPNIPDAVAVGAVHTEPAFQAVQRDAARPLTTTSAVRRASAEANTLSLEVLEVDQPSAGATLANAYSVLASALVASADEGNATSVTWNANEPELQLALRSVVTAEETVPPSNG
jgi:hypothetical protein